MEGTRHSRMQPDLGLDDRRPRNQLRDGQLNDQPKAVDFALEPQPPSRWPHQPPVLAIHRIGKSLGSGATTRE